MYADVVLQVQNKDNVLTVPVQAVQRNNEQPNVFVLDAQNHVTTRAIQTGIQEPAKVEVVSGLREGDRVIVGNLNAYHEGEVVDPKMSALTDAQMRTSGE